jgi:hypothetical protein
MSKLPPATPPAGPATSGPGPVSDQSAARYAGVVEPIGRAVAAAARMRLGVDRAPLDFRTLLAAHAAPLSKPE